MTTDSPAITIPDDAWEASEGIDVLLATVTINGTPFHVEAWRCYVDDDGVQRSYYGDPVLATIHQCLGGDGPWETVDITGHPYILIVHPYH